MTPTIMGVGVVAATAGGAIVKKVKDWWEEKKIAKVYADFLPHIQEVRGDAEVRKKSKKCLREEIDKESKANDELFEKVKDLLNKIDHVKGRFEKNCI